MVRDEQEFWTNATIPAYPMLFTDGMTTDLSTVDGQVGILLNGVSQFRWDVHGRSVCGVDSSLCMCSLRHGGMGTTGCYELSSFMAIVY